MRTLAAAFMGAMLGFGLAAALYEWSYRDPVARVRSAEVAAADAADRAKRTARDARAEAGLRKLEHIVDDSRERDRAFLEKRLRLAEDLLKMCSPQAHLEYLLAVQKALGGPPPAAP